MAIRLTILLRLLLIAGLGGLAGATTGFAAPDYVEGEVLVTFKEGTDLPSARQALTQHTLGLAKHFKNLSEYRHRQTGLVRAHGRTTAALVAELAKDAAVETVEPNYLRWASATVPTNETLFAKLWGLQNTGQSVNGVTGTAGDDIQFVGAWNAASPAPGQVVVAVIDTGIDYTHPDLASSMWTNPGGIPGDTYVGDHYGYDFADNSSDPMDSGLHGTHVSGTIAAAGIATGVVGVNHLAKIMALKASSDGSTFTDAAIIEAIQYATMMKNGGVNVVAINASFGGGNPSSTESSAIQAAGTAGIIFCAAAGNNSANNDTTPTYPASYGLANMIVVAATDQNDALASFSDYGPTTVDLAAPGVNILSTVPLSQAGTTATVQQASVNYPATGLTDAGITTGITASVYDCGLGYPTNFPSGVSGNIALINRGTLTFAAKVTNAMAAGALAAIIYNNVAGSFQGTLGSSNNWIPAVSISQADGLTLRALLPATATVINAIDPTQIYQYLDGTSMATPHVVGAVAFTAMNYPSDTVVQRIQRILANVDIVAGLQTKLRTGGRLNLNRILGAVDTTPPSVSITNPVSGTTYTAAQTVTLLATASDNVGVARVEFYDTGVLKSTDNTAPYSAVWSFTIANNGVHSWTARAYDAAGNVTTSAVVTLTVNIPVPCAYGVVPISAGFPTSGGNSNVTVNTIGSCSWTATSNAGWLTITGGNSGSGTGIVSYAVAANTGPARSGTLAVAGQTVTINQASDCTYVLGATSTNLPVSGGTGHVMVTDSAGCTWTATSNAGWLTVTAGSSGTGNGLVSYAGAANPSPARTGVLTIGGQTFTVNQGNGCSYALSTTNLGTGASGGLNSVVVTAGAGCLWTSSSNVGWISINSGNSGSGNGTVSCTVVPNSGPARSGTLTVAGQTVAVNQASGCTYVLNTTNATATVNGGTGNVFVTAGIGCPWTSASNVGWLNITAGTNSSGNGVVSYAVATNTSPARSGTLTIAGQTVTISQGNGCTFVLSATNTPAAASGGDGSVTVAAGDGCAWTAASNAPWITLLTSSTNTGSAAVNYTVAANTGPARAGTLSIAGQTFTVNQANGCACVLNVTNATAAAGGGAGTITVTAGVDCVWTAASNAGWLTVTAGNRGTGNGSVSYTIATNVSPARIGILTIGGQMFTVTQDDGCVYTLSATNVVVDTSGGPGSITITAGAGCPWTAASNAGWLTITAGGNGDGPGSISYLVATNPGPARTGTLTIAGQTCTLNQANGCTYLLSGGGTNVLESGGTGSFGVTTFASCDWSAVSTAPDWLHTSSTGPGTGAVSFTVDASNTTNSRTANIVVQGQTFVVNQEPVLCTYELTASQTNLPARGGSGSVGLNVAAPCFWAASSDSDWLQTTSAGTGAGSVQFNVAANLTASTRTGTLNVQGQKFVVNQPPEHSPAISAGPVITNALLNVLNLAVVAAGTNAAFVVTATDPDGDPLSYQWAFGDGTGSTDAAPWHAYGTNVCGVYTASVVVADGLTPSPTGTLRVAVACQLNISQLQLRPNFAKNRADKAKLFATFVPGGNVTLAGLPVTVDIGNALVSFVLNKTGHGTSTNGTCTVTHNKRLGWTIALALKSGSWNQGWQAYDLLNAPIKVGVPVQVPVVVLIGNDAYAADRSLTYTAVVGKSGLAK